MHWLSCTTRCLTLFSKHIFSNFKVELFIYVLYGKISSHESSIHSCVTFKICPKEWSAEYKILKQNSPFLIISCERNKYTHSFSSRVLFCKDEQNRVFIPTGILNYESLPFDSKIEILPTLVINRLPYLTKNNSKKKVCKIISFNRDNHDNKDLNKVYQRKT